MTMKMKAPSIASAIPSLVDQDPKVEMSTDLEIAVSLLQEVARKMKAAGLQRESGADQETPPLRTER
jgi:hypothetical protein